MSSGEKLGHGATMIAKSQVRTVWSVEGVPNFSFLLAVFPERLGEAFFSVPSGKVINFEAFSPLAADIMKYGAENLFELFENGPPELVDLLSETHKPPVPDLQLMVVYSTTSEDLIPLRYGSFALFP